MYKQHSLQENFFSPTKHNFLALQAKVVKKYSVFGSPNFKNWIILRGEEREGEGDFFERETNFKNFFQKLISLNFSKAYQ